MPTGDEIWAFIAARRNLDLAARDLPMELGTLAFRHPDSQVPGPGGSADRTTLSRCGSGRRSR
jgi:hypothetical protein